ncbi:uncharacterized protein LOC135502288 [Lineus longissimus]|uniref:uncharacterized protein LOC135502288 n=1 Tax=Lineus longissimus TaxID=88925 RepID=UPI002B4EB2E8
MTLFSRTDYMRVLVVSVAGVTAGFLIFQYSPIGLSARTKSIYSVSQKSQKLTSIRGTRINQPKYRDITVGTLRKDRTRNAAIGEKVPNTKMITAATTSRKTATEKYPPGMFPGGPPVPYNYPVVPKIVHHTWFSFTKSDKMNRFRFHHFISMLSAYKYIKPTKIVFWHDTEPSGKWWTKIRQKVPIIEMKYRKAPTEIHGKPVRGTAHASDIVRLEAIMEFGGIYTDLDVVVLKSFDPLLKYNTTMGYETGPNVANGLCNGVIISRPRAKFLEIWHYEYRTFDDAQWAIHSVILPAQLARKYPSLIHTEAKSLHRPNWMERKWLYNDGSLYDWSKNYAVHLWYRYHKVDHNPEDIKKLNTTMGELFRYIYYGKKDLIF